MDPRTIFYPLEAVRHREGWRLDALQADLAQASQKLEQAKQERTGLHDEHRAVAAAASPAAASVIDPAVAASRLAYLRSVLGKQAEADIRLQQRAADRAQLQALHEKQRTRLESVERHRSAFVRSAAAEDERRARAEADRDWLARLQWHRTAAGDEKS